MSARFVARHLGKHIPGNPTVVVENVTGAGGLVQINSLFKSAKPDGLTIGYLNGGLLFCQPLGQPGYDFDSRKFVYVGAPTKDNNVFGLTKKSGITSVEKWRDSKTPVKMGGVVPGNPMDNMARLMKDVLGFPTQVVTGYKGGSDVRLAMENGELAGAALNWDHFKVNWKNALETGEGIIVVQCVAKPLPELPNVPLMISLAKTDDQRRLVEVAAYDINEYSRPFAAPPGTPKERVEILRKAFQDMYKDKEFIAEADKGKFTLDPVDTEKMERAIEAVYKLDPALLAKLKTILFK